MHSSTSSYSDGACFRMKEMVLQGQRVQPRMFRVLTCIHTHTLTTNTEELPSLASVLTSEITDLRSPETALQ